MLERVEPGRTSRPTKRGSAWGHLTAGGWRAVARRWWLVVAMLAFGGAIAALPAVLGGTASAYRQHPSSAVALASLGPGPEPTVAPQPNTLPPPLTGAHRHRPNIVFVLTDDLSMDLLPYMPAVQALEDRGTTLTNYYVSDSLCCPSRASIFTGNFPHDTGVFTNTGPHGGFNVFHARGEQNHTFNIALQKAGYRTAMMGKYLNGYLEGNKSTVPDTYVPPGWNEWDVAGWGYPEYDYNLNHDGEVRWYGHRPRDYLTDVLARMGTRFIDNSAHSRNPFFLELATFAPHSPYTPAPRYRHSFPGLTAPEPPNFDAIPTDAPQWLANRPPLRPGQIRYINYVFRRRVQAVQSVDSMISRIEGALRAHRMLHDTYIVFSSDNGLHTGEYRLMPGKLTAFNTDIHVPLVIAGPGVPADTTSDAMAENVDLAKTFAAIAGTRMPSDGHSLMALLRGEDPPDWRDAILVEHHGPVTDPDDPDIQNSLSGNPPSYEAMRTPDFLYVEYRNGGREFYDLRTDPFELHNIVSTLTPEEQELLHSELLALENCHTGPRCWAAEHVGPATLAIAQGRGHDGRDALPDHPHRRRRR
jgi:N-acetylglucosamine-6-sulfatase